MPQMKSRANDALRPIPVDDQVLGEGAVGDRRVKDAGEKVVRAKTGNQLASAKLVIAKCGGKILKTEKVPAGGWEITYTEGDKAEDGLEPIPVNDTEWNDPKSRGPYKLTTSAALKTPSEVKEAYGKKDPEGFKKTFGKDSDQDQVLCEKCGKAEADGVDPVSKSYLCAACAKKQGIKLKAEDSGLEPIPVKDSFNDLVGKLERVGKSKEYATKIAGKVAAEKKAAKDEILKTGEKGWLQHVTMNQGTWWIPVTCREKLAGYTNLYEVEGGGKIYTTNEFYLHRTKPADAPTSPAKRKAKDSEVPIGFAAGYTTKKAKDASDDCMECGKSIPYGDEFCKVCASKLGLQHRANSMRRGSKFEQWDAKRHGLSLEAYRKEYGTDAAAKDSEVPIGFAAGKSPEFRAAEWARRQEELQSAKTAKGYERIVGKKAQDADNTKARLDKLKAEYAKKPSAELKGQIERLTDYLKQLAKAQPDKYPFSEDAAPANDCCYFVTT